jgi:uncharacterized protein (TIGR02147 family)
MTIASIFEFNDYKKFVIEWIEQAPHNGRGLRKGLAEAIGCQTPFITHVLAGTYHFSLEHADACARWMKLPEAEADFFLLLVLRQRAGTKSLEKTLTKQISQKREIHAVLKSRLKIEETLPREDQLLYYSSWIYAAIHIAVLNPACQSIEGLQNALKVPTPQIMNALEFLTSRGLLKKTKFGYQSARPMLHLEADSPLMHQHHTNWRLKALENLSVRSAESLQYSGVMSLSENDFEWVREKLSHLLEETIERIKDSKDERLACMCFDWFSLSQNS